MSTKLLSAQDTCCQCGMERPNWSAKTGYEKEGATFCCERCADETGCQCEEKLRQAIAMQKASRKAAGSAVRVARR